MDRSVLIKEVTYRAFIDEIEKIAGSLSEEEWEKLAGMFSRIGMGTKNVVENKIAPTLKRGYEGAQVGVGKLMSGHMGEGLSEAAQEGLHHGGMFMGVDPGDFAHAAHAGAEAFGARAALAAAPMAANAIRRHGPRAVGFLKRKGGELAEHTRSAMRPFIGGGPPQIPSFVPSYA